MTNLFFFIFSVLLVSILFFLSKICFRCLSSTPSSEDRAAAEEELKVAKAELAARFKIKEKELRSALDKELERRSRAWTSWFEKYQSEEQRLCERARGLAEQNVSLQRQVSSFNQREAERRELISNLAAWAKEVMEENQSLQQNLSELQEKYRAAAEDRDFFKRKYEEKDEESKELHKSITRLLPKESEVEQLRAELAAAVRGNDVLRAEVQNTLDDLSCATQELQDDLSCAIQESKDLELQMLKKDENINCLQNDFEEATKHLSIMEEILPKVFGDRDMLWEQVKRCSEENMLLSAEVNILKKKIEGLEEDVLLNKGQITILKDSLGSRREFLLE